LFFTIGAIGLRGAIRAIALLGCEGQCAPYPQVCRPTSIFCKKTLSAGAKCPTPGHVPRSVLVDKENGALLIFFNARGGLIANERYKILEDNRQQIIQYFEPISNIK
jgi:hypothetical protein